MLATHHRLLPLPLLPHRRHWGWKNALCGCMDASWGALGEVMTEIGLTPAELEEPEVPWAMPANTRSRGVG